MAEICACEGDWPHAGATAGSSAIAATSARMRVKTKGFAFGILRPPPAMKMRRRRSIIEEREIRIASLASGDG
jgi:hypothetical protein